MASGQVIITIPANSTSATFTLTPAVPDGTRYLAIVSTNPALTAVGSPLAVNVTNPATTITLSGSSSIQAGTSAVYTVSLDHASTIPVVVSITDSLTGGGGGLPDNDQLTTP
jgi:hypothetical protein